MRTHRGLHHAQPLGTRGGLSQHSLHGTDWQRLLKNQGAASCSCCQRIAQLPLSPRLCHLTRLAPTAWFPRCRASDFSSPFLVSLALSLARPSGARAAGLLGFSLPCSLSGRLSSPSHHVPAAAPQMSDVDPPKSLGLRVPGPWGPACLHLGDFPVGTCPQQESLPGRLFHILPTWLPLCSSLP